jgi:hypothetical protein
MNTTKFDVPVSEKQFVLFNTVTNELVRFNGMIQICSNTAGTVLRLYKTHEWTIARGMWLCQQILNLNPYEFVDDALATKLIHYYGGIRARRPVEPDLDPLYKKYTDLVETARGLKFKDQDIIVKRQLVGMDLLDKVK